MGASYEGIDIGVLRISCTVTMTQKSSLSRESIKQQAGGMELQLTSCLALDMASQRISFLVVLLCTIVVTESFAVVRFWRPQGSIIENKGKKNGNVNKTKEKYTRLLHLWCSNNKVSVIHVHVYFFASDGKNNNKLNNKNNTSTSNEMETERQERNNDTGRQPITQSRTRTI